MIVTPDEPTARALVAAIRGGNVDTLKRLLARDPGLAAARIEGCRSLLHIATDWPGHVPHGAATVQALVEAGADLEARFVGEHAERPLHWAASSDDIEVLDALIDAGADLEAGGSVISGGTPLADAVAFGQWNAAQRLVERGARTTLWQAAALGLADRVQTFFAGEAPPPDEVTNAFWQACHGGQRATAEYLLARGAELNWVGWGEQTAVDIARAQGADAVVDWLLSIGGKPVAELAELDQHRSGDQ